MTCFCTLNPTPKYPSLPNRLPSESICPSVSIRARLPHPAVWLVCTPAHCPPTHSVFLLTAPAFTCALWALCGVLSFHIHNCVACAASPHTPRLTQCSPCLFTAFLTLQHFVGAPPHSHCEINMISEKHTVGSCGV